MGIGLVADEFLILFPAALRATLCEYCAGAFVRLATSDNFSTQQHDGNDPEQNVSLDRFERGYLPAHG